MRLLILFLLMLTFYFAVLLLFGVTWNYALAYAFGVSLLSLTVIALILGGGEGTENLEHEYREES